jgi:hypothetical protein
MANFDTVVALSGGTGRGQIKVLTLAAITETLFAVNTDTAGTTTVASVSAPSGNAGKLVGSGSPIEFNQNSAISSQSFGRKVSVFTEPPYFSTATFDAGRPFKIRVCGTASVAAVTVTTVTNTININIYAGTAISSTMKIATLTAAGTNSSTTAAVTGQFDLEAVVQWDSTTGTLSGYFGGNNMNTFKANAALSNAVAITSAANLIFSPSAVFADTSAGSVTISELAIDQI